MSNSLKTHGMQHIKVPYPSPSPRVCSNSCPLSQWQHPTISPSVTHFSSCPHSFPASGSFPIIWLFASGGQSIRAWPSASVLPMNIQSWFPLELTGLTSCPRDSQKNLHQHHSSTISIFGAWPSLCYNSHIHIWYWKNHNFEYMTFVGKVMSQLLNMLSRFVIAFLPRSKCLLILWLQSPAAVILEPKKIKKLLLFPLSPHLFAMKWWYWIPWS